MNPEIQPLVENIEILNGARGSGLDRAVLLRDLVDLGLAGTVKTSGGKVRPVTGTPGTGTPGGGTSPTPDPTVEDPVAPTGVYASGGFSNILIAWDSPGYKGHAYANIYRSATDDYSQAVAISQTAANLYSDTVAVGATWYYWIRFVNKNDKEGPIQSTNGVKGTTSAAIGDILDQLKGEIDETFFTPVFNTRLDDTDKDIQQLFGDVTNIDNKFTDKFVQVEDQFVEFDGKFVDVNSIIDELKEAGEIIAEAAMSAAVGVEIESDTRRKITARIEEKQRTIITDQIAMAEDIKTVTATVDDNKAQISINNTALVELDKDTKEAVKTITERLDTQQSNIDDNKASITNQQQTLVSVQDSVNKNTGEIDATKQDVQAVTTRLDKQQSEIDDNKATITTQQQTIITIDGKVTGNADDIKDTADKVEVITQRVDTLTSEVGDNKAQISQTQQTLITIDGKVTDNEKEIGDNAKSIQVVTTRIDQQQSEIDSNKATITSQSQTIIKIDGEVQKNKADVEKAITAASNAQATADGKIDTFFQDSHPANASSGDIWFDTNDGNKQYVYQNGAWVVAQDTAIGDAILAAAGAQATADGKIETFYQPTEPQAVAIGDLWVDTDDKNKLYRWNGTQWADIQDGEISDVKDSVQVITQKVDELSSEVEGSKALISQLNQTIITVDDKTSDNKGEIDKNAKSIEVVTTRLDKQQSEIDTNKASITTQQQTIVRIDGEVQGNKSGIAGAIAAAADAKATADGKIDTYFQDDAPLSAKDGDIWFDTNDGNKQYVHHNGGWVVAQDTEIGDAIAAAAGAQATADGKIETFYQPSEPQGVSLGDLWVDTDDKNHLYRWNGTQWVDIKDGNIDEALAEAEKAIQDAASAQASADGKINTFFQDDAPPSASGGDIWFDTNDGNKQYIYHNGAWIVAQDTAIGDAILAAAGAQATADGKIETFYQPDAPTASAKGDLWVDTDDKNKLYRWSGSAWVDIHDQNIDEIKGDVEVITQRVDTMKSEVDNNTAEITDTKQTLVTIDGKVSDNANDIADANQSITTMTQRLESQQSEIDGNKASITSQAQTIVTIDGKVSQNASDIDTANKSIETITQKQDEQKSELDGAKAVIESNSQTIARIEGELGEDGDNSQEILAEAVMSSAIGVDNEGSTRRKVTARIEKQQRVIMTDQSAMAQELTIITASVADNKAEIKSVNTALVEFDKETEQALKVMTERLDTQKANIDDNTASITTQQQTIVTIDGKVQDNTEEVAKAIASASNAQATADGKIDTFFQDDEPATASEGDIWFDTNSGNKQYIYQSGSWVIAQDTEIGDAIKAAAGAQATADGKIETFYQTTPPTANAEGDLWIDTNNNDRLYRWNSLTWVDIQDKDIHKAIQDAASAQATADGKIDTFFQDGEPQAASEGDLWFDTDNGNKQHVYKNGAWIVAQDTAIGDAILAAATAQSTADGKITTFYVPDAPKAKAVGDLWVDTNDKNKLYRWSGSNWLDIQDGNINEIDGKVTVITERLDQLKSEVDGNTASITTNSQTIIEVNSKAEANESKINVVSQQLTTVESELGDTKSAVSTNSQTIAKMNADGTTAYEAQWGVKASVGDVQAGIGLVAKKNPDGTTTSQCTVLADQFSVGHVNTDGDDETIYPFIVTSEGVYIDTAYIKAATVQELVAGEVIADTVKASASITAPKIKGGTIEIGSNFSVDENGNATTNNIKGNNVHLTGYINATSGTFRGTVYATTGEFKGTVYATDGDFKGTVYANRIVGDVVTANTKKKSNSVGYFDRARVNKPTSKNRTLQFTVMVGLKAKGYRDQEGRFQPSTVEGRLKVTGTYGTRYSQIFSFSTNRSSEESRFFPVNVSIPIPANTTGTVNIYSEKTHSVGETSVVTSAPTTDGIWTAMLFTDGSDLS
ncbi:tail fiber protein [Vibrio phage D171]